MRGQDVDFEVVDGQVIGIYKLAGVSATSANFASVGQTPPVSPSPVSAGSSLSLNVATDKGLFEHFKTCITKDYANFNGRARRREYWGFMLFSTIYIILLYILVAILGSISEGLAGFVFIVGYLTILLPSLAVAVRRLHDIDKSGWFLLLHIVPFGSIVLLVFACLDSHPYANRYGVSPKYQ